LTRRSRCLRVRLVERTATTPRSCSALRASRDSASFPCGLALALLLSLAYYAVQILAFHAVPNLAYLVVSLLAYSVERYLAYSVRRLSSFHRWVLFTRSMKFSVSCWIFFTHFLVLNPQGISGFDFFNY